MSANTLTRDGRHIHLVGVGGIGVSALAPALIDRGFRVSGSDPARNAITARLSELGVNIYHEHEAGNINGAELIVATSAAKDDNPEIAAAKAKGIEIWPRAKMLGALLNEYRSIVVTGAHGKTTLTALLTHTLASLGLDPTGFIGGEMPEGGNCRLGRGEWAIAEGDESDGSFIFLHPEVAIINNIDDDHLDFYENHQAIVQQFQRFIDGLPDHAWVLHSADDANCRSLSLKPTQRRLTYGFSPEADIHGYAYVARSADWGCQAAYQGQPLGELRLQLPGRFQTHNALAAVALAVALQLPVQETLRAVGAFRGVRRRMERKGEAHGVIVLDDYAHHPNEIKATLEGLREQYSGRLIGVFQPHLYSRTLSLLDEFSRCFNQLDLLILTEIYPAREPVRHDMSGEMLLPRVRAEGVRAVYLPLLDEAAGFLRAATQPGDVVVTLGAGNVWTVGEAFLHQQQQEAAR